MVALPDLVNGSFELLGGLFILNHCRAVERDKAVKGVSIISVAFFTMWGVWNLWYYPHLNQWLSFAGGVVITIANFWYLWLLKKYYVPFVKEPARPRIYLKNFTMHPTGRYLSDSANSAHAFFLWLEPQLPYKEDLTVEIDLGGTTGIGSNFLDELACRCAFYISIKKIVFVSSDDPTLVTEINQYVDKYLGQETS